MGTELEERGEEEETTSAGRGQPPFEQSRDVMLDAVAGDHAWAWRAGAVKDFDLLFGKESGGEWRGRQPFFFDRP